MLGIKIMSRNVFYIILFLNNCNINRESISQSLKIFNKHQSITNTLTNKTAFCKEEPYLIKSNQYLSKLFENNTVDIHHTYKTFPIRFNDMQNIGMPCSKKISFKKPVNYIQKKVKNYILFLCEKYSQYLPSNLEIYVSSGDK